MPNKELSLTITQAILKGKEEECERIARDLHDSLAQELSIVHMRMEILSLDKKLGHVTNEIKELQSLIRSILQSIRDITQNLSPRIIVKNLLSESLLKLIEKYGANSHPKVVYNCTQQISLKSNKDELNVFRIVQEFIHNSIKHSNATCIEVTLSEHEEIVALHLSDDGVGFDLKSCKNSGGVSNILNRINSMGAKHSFGSYSKIGTSLKLYINERSK